MKAYLLGILMLTLRLTAMGQQDTLASPPPDPLQDTISIQADADQAADPDPLGEASTVKVKLEDEDLSDGVGLKEKVALIIGIGGAYVTDRIWQDPVVDRATGMVKMEEAARLRPNYSLGISYTPYFKNVIRHKNTVKDGQLKRLTIADYYPAGPSIAIFVNPLVITKVSEASTLASLIDCGIGIGGRWGAFSAYATAEAIALHQPRSYFVTEYSGNNRQYIIGEDVQSAIDKDDVNVFHDPVFFAFGVKLAYTFNLVQGFGKGIATEVSDQAAPESGLDR